MNRLSVSALFITAMLFSGCASNRTVYVPVSSCPEPPPVSMPELQVPKLPQPAPTDQALKAIAEDYITMKAELQRLITLLEAYRKKPVQ